jgi:NADPH:quinone reductase
MLLSLRICKLPIRPKPWSYSLSGTYKVCELRPSKAQFHSSTPRDRQPGASTNKMKEVKVYKSTNEAEGLTTKLVDIPTPTPKPDEVLIKVIVSGTNPKDWKYVSFSPKPAPGPGLNTGDDIAGYVSSVGSDVTEFKAGDRVGAFHVMRSPSGSFAEYAIAPVKTTFHLPKKTSFEEAATIPLAAMTAVVGLYARLGLPEPWAKVHPAREIAKQGGVLVYGAASAVGAFAVKLLARADVHPIICVAGRGIPYVESLIDKSQGDVVVDYRKGDAAVVDGIKAAIPSGGKLMYCFDAVSENGSVPNICKVLDSHGHISTVLPGQKYPEIKSTMKATLTTVGSVHKVPDDLEDLGFAWFRVFSLGLQEGWFSGHPYEVVPGGLEGVVTGLRNLRDGKASALKYVYRVEDTPGLSGSKI